MSRNIQPVTGMKDVLAAEIGAWQHVENTMAKVLALTTWLTVVAYRIATREFVRRIRAREVEAAKPVATPPARDSEVFETLERLPELDRRALVMFHVDDCSYREISDQLGIPLNQVGMVLLRAREKLARVLRPSHEK